jgi:hypothetical protein
VAVGLNDPTTGVKVPTAREWPLLAGPAIDRSKVIGRFPGETSCLTLVWAVLDLYITHAKNGVRSNQLELQRLRRMRYAGNEPTTDEEVSSA